MRSLPGWATSMAMAMMEDKDLRSTLPSVTAPNTENSSQKFMRCDNTITYEANNLNKLRKHTPDELVKLIISEYKPAQKEVSHRRENFGWSYSSDFQIKNLLVNISLEYTSIYSSFARLKMMFWPHRPQILLHTFAPRFYAWLLKTKAIVEQAGRERYAKAFKK